MAKSNPKPAADKKTAAPSAPDASAPDTAAAESSAPEAASIPSEPEAPKAAPSTAKAPKAKASDRLAELIAEKRAAGLTLKQAEECARAQIEHDNALASAAKK